MVSLVSLFCPGTDLIDYINQLIGME